MIWRSDKEEPVGKINLSRVILGGIVAGIVIDLFEGIMNGMVLAGDWSTVLTGLGKAPAPSVKQIVAFNVWGFAVGLVAVWLYAAIRPRFGAGPKTAACAGLFVWATAYALGTAPQVFMHLYPVGMMSTLVAVGLVEMVVATIAGGYFYKEDASPTLARSAAA
jgi:hypothetical protein